MVVRMGRVVGLMRMEMIIVRGVMRSAMMMPMIWMIYLKIWTLREELEGIQGLLTSLGVRRVEHLSQEGKRMRQWRESAQINAPEMRSAKDEVKLHEEDINDRLGESGLHSRNQRKDKMDEETIDMLAEYENSEDDKIADMMSIEMKKTKMCGDIQLNAKSREVNLEQEMQTPENIAHMYEVMEEGDGITSEQCKRWEEFMEGRDVMEVEDGVKLLRAMEL
jgi:hypothetical protein